MTIRTRHREQLLDVNRIPLEILFADGSSHKTLGTIVARKFGWDGCYCVDEIIADVYRCERAQIAIALRLPGGRLSPIESGDKRLRAGDMLHARGRIRAHWGELTAEHEALRVRLGIVDATPGLELRGHLAIIAARDPELRVRRWLDRVLARVVRWCERLRRWGRGR